MKHLLSLLGRLWHWVNGPLHSVCEQNHHNIHNFVPANCKLMDGVVSTGEGEEVRQVKVVLLWEQQASLNRQVGDI